MLFIWCAMRLDSSFAILRHNCPRLKVTRGHQTSKVLCLTCSTKRPRSQERTTRPNTRPLCLIHATRVQITNSTRSLWCQTKLSKCLLISSCPRARTIFSTVKNRKKPTLRSSNRNTISCLNQTNVWGNTCMTPNSQSSRTLSYRQASQVRPEEVLLSTWPLTSTKLTTWCQHATPILKSTLVVKSPKLRMKESIIISRSVRSNLIFKKRPVSDKWSRKRKRCKEKESTVRTNVRSPKTVQRISPKSTWSEWTTYLRRTRNTKRWTT